MYFLRIIECDRYDERAHLGLVCALAGALVDGGDRSVVVFARGLADALGIRGEEAPS